MWSTRLLGAMICTALGLAWGESVEAQTRDDLGSQSGMFMFASRDVTQQRIMLRALIEHVSEATTRQGIEAILVSRFVPDTDIEVKDKISGQVSYPLVTMTRYEFKFQYGDLETGTQAGLVLNAMWVGAQDVADDDSQCLSLPDIKRFAEQAGWTLHAPSVGRFQHDISASKGHLQLDAVADGGVGEYSTADQAADWEVHYAARGCVENLKLYVG